MGCDVMHILQKFALIETFIWDIQHLDNIELKNTHWYIYTIYRNTKTYLWDITDLDNIVLMNTYVHEITVIDHNQYRESPEVRPPCE